MKKIQSHNRWSHIFHALSAHIKRNITESVNYSCRYGINSRMKGMHNCSWQTRKRNPEIFYLNVNSNSVAQRETKIYVMWVMGFADNIRYDGFGNVRKKKCIWNLQSTISKTNYSFSFITICILHGFSIHKYSFNIYVLIRMAYWNIMILDIDLNIHISPFCRIFVVCRSYCPIASCWSLVWTWSLSL